MEGLATVGYDELKKRLDESQAKKSIAENTMRECVDQKLVHQERLAKLYMQRVHSNPSDSKVMYVVDSYSSIKFMYIVCI